MAPRKQVKKEAAGSTLDAASGNVMSKKKVIAKSVITSTPKKTRMVRQMKQVKEHETITATTTFSPMKLRSKEKNIISQKNTEDKPEKMFVKQQKKKTIENNSTEIVKRVVEKKIRNDSKAVTVKKATTKTVTAKLRAKVPISKKLKNEVENIISGENPPKKTIRQRKIVNEENVASTARKIRNVKTPKRSGNAETEMIVEADGESEEKNNAEMIVASKKSRGRAKKTAEVTVKERSKKNSTKKELALSEETKGAIPPQKYVKMTKKNNQVEDNETSDNETMNLVLEVDNNDAKDVFLNNDNVSEEESIMPCSIFDPIVPIVHDKTMEDFKIKTENLSDFERSATFVQF